MNENLCRLLQQPAEDSLNVAIAPDLIRNFPNAEAGNHALRIVQQTVERFHPQS